MADPVGLGIRTPDAFQTLGSLLNFSNTAQNVQRGNIDLQQNQIRLEERKAIQNLFSNPQSFKSPDGLFDYNKLITEGMKVAPTTFPLMVPQIISAHKEGVAAQQAFNSLDAAQRQAVGQFLGSSVGDDYPTITRKLEALGNANPQLKPYIDFARKHHIDKGDPKDQKRLDAAMQKVSQWALSVPEQRAANTPQALDVGTNSVRNFINLNPSAPGGVGAPIPGASGIQQTLGPGSLESIETAQDGSKHIVSRSPQGSILSTRPLGGNAPQGNPATPASYNPLNPVPGQTQDVPVLTAERAAMNTAAMRVPESRMNNREILKLTDETSTGKGAEILARLGGGYAAIPWSATNSADNFNRLGHYIARESSNMASAMGLNGTDAGRGLAEQANVSTGWTKDAIKSAVKVNDALATSVGKFNEGMEAAIRNAGGNVLAARDFKNAWSKSFDPDVYRYANALEAGDKAEIDKILGKPGSAERASRARVLAAKSAMLNQLVTNGRGN